MSRNVPSPVFEAVRAKSKINIAELTSLIYGSAENYQKFVTRTDELDSMGFFPDSFPDMSRVDLMGHVIAKTQEWRKLTGNENFFDKNPPDAILNMVQNITGGIGLFMALPCIEHLGTDQQIADWSHKISNGDFLTSYVQTELGHGSDIQSLKTTATYDQTTNEWVINTPSVDAYKWWPGDLGLTSNWIVLYGQIIVKGERKGVFPLFCQIRDMKTHKLLPKLIVGDIGPKWGYATKDNGFMAFDNFRIPANALLGRYAGIDKHGNWKTRGNMKVLYASMMFVREKILAYCGKGLGNSFPPNKP
jgi:acyl-CoA oxidase